MNKTRRQTSIHFIRHSRRLLTPALLCVFLLAAACNTNVFNQDYVATVNGEKIYLDDYQHQLSARKTKLSGKSLPASAGKRLALDEEILETLIMDRIFQQRAKELNIAVSNTELENKILDIRKDYGANFFDLLVSENVRYEEWREQLKKEMLFDKLVAKDVNERIRVSDDEAEDYLEDHPGLCKKEAHVRASQIVVRDLQKAEAIQARLAAGEDFAAVAAEASIGPEKTRGGDLGLIARQTMPDPLDKTLFSLPVNTVSPIIKSPYGYHLLKVTDIQRAGTKSFAECKEDIIPTLRAQKEDAAFKAWLDGLKIKAVVKRESGALGKATSK